MQQQDGNTLIYWAPSRVRFNLTLILAAVVVVLGALQFVGLDPISAVCNPPQSNNAASQQQQDGSGSSATDAAPPPRRSNNGWLLIVVGLGVGAYSWLTSPRQYRVYGDALMILFGAPRRRTIHFRDIREVVNDRGPMGDPLRVYTNNRRRIPIQVREPEEMHRYLDQALADFRRDNPQYAPPPPPEPEGETPADTDDAGPATGSGNDAGAGRPESAPETAGEQSPRNRPARRRRLREDGDDSSTGDAGSGNDAAPPPRSSRRRSLRGDNDGDSGGNGDDSRPPFT